MRNLFRTIDRFVVKYDPAADESNVHAEHMVDTMHKYISSVFQDFDESFAWCEMGTRKIDNNFRGSFEIDSMDTDQALDAMKHIETLTDELGAFMFDGLPGIPELRHVAQKTLDRLRESIQMETKAVEEWLTNTWMKIDANHEVDVPYDIDEGEVYEKAVAEGKDGWEAVHDTRTSKFQGGLFDAMVRMGAQEITIPTE